MPSWDKNLYYKPEKWGLEILAEIDTGGSYEFNMSVLFKAKDTGGLYLGQDSGCSCPSPFENFEKGRESLILVKDDAEVYRLVRDYHYGLNTEEFLNFMRKVREAFKAQKEK